MKSVIFILLVFSSIASGYSQTFTSSENKYSKQNIVQYYNKNAGIIIQKLINRDSLSDSYYEIGLLLFRNAISSNYFMDDNSVIVFEDESFILIEDISSVNYNYPGKHEFFVRHKLSSHEFELLKSKKIKSFTIGKENKDLDKWEKVEILKAFIEIEAK